MLPLAGRLVVDLTRYLPGPFASRELLRLGARVVRLEPPGGDPMREIAPA
jgi:alpha-methylacyl-CoA racemase